MSSGIYVIVNTENGNRYIGSAADLSRRENSHFQRPHTGRHENVYLQNSYNTHGRNSFIFNIVELCDSSVLLEREQYYIDTLNPEYNIAKSSTSPMMGRKHTPETLLKMSKSRKGFGLGRKLSPETRRKISESLMGKRKGIKGKKHTAETKLKMSISHMGNKSTLGRTDRAHTEETKLKISLANKGKKRTDEEKKRMSDAQRHRHSKSSTTLGE